MPAAKPGSLNRRQFFDRIEAGLRGALKPPLSDFRYRANPMLLKIDYGNDRVHYEVWVDSLRERVEIGLHFEDGPVSTAAYLAFFNSRIVEIKHHLGPSIELERWTASWGHVFETLPLAPLNPAFAESAARRLVAQISLLQPMVVEAAIPAGQHAVSPPEHRRWRRRGSQN